MALECQHNRIKRFPSLCPKNLRINVYAKRSGMTMMKSDRVILDLGEMLERSRNLFQMERILAWQELIFTIFFRPLSRLHHYDIR